MIDISNTEVMGWDAAIRGMRNPLNSWSKSDSKSVEENCEECMYKADYSVCKHNPIHKCFNFDVGEADHDLMRRLAAAGSDHAKYRRMITVYADVIAPLYWWKEYDTYKVGTVANSCSTMHKIADNEFMLGDFSHEHLENLPLVEKREVEGWEVTQLNQPSLEILKITIMALNSARFNYLKAKENGADGFTLKRYWWQMIQLLPSSYNQKRTIMVNYEVLANMYHARKNHKLDEWREFCKWIESLPYSELITGGVKNDG